MKLAEALMLRSDLKKKLLSLRQRIGANAVVQDGEKPHEDPAELIRQATGVLKELESLIDRINHANQANKLDGGRTVAEVIGRRDTLAQQHAILVGAIESSRKEPDRYSMSEIKWVATLDVAGLQKQADDLAVKIRETNAKLQEANWQIEVE